LAKSEDGPLFGPREGNEEGRNALRIAGDVSPPCIVVEAYEDDRVIFEPFALMDSHQRDLIDALECIEAGHPVGCAFGGREEMDAKGFEDDLEEVSYAIFGIGSGDGSQVEIFKNPSGEVRGAHILRTSQPVSDRARSFSAFH
jgi:hypothetical protein